MCPPARCRTHATLWFVCCVCGGGFPPGAPSWRPSRRLGGALSRPCSCTTSTRFNSLQVVRVRLPPPGTRNIWASTVWGLVHNRAGVQAMLHGGEQLTNHSCKHAVHALSVHASPAWPVLNASHHGCDRSAVGARVHPNIESKKSVTWIERVFVQYHAGHKVGIDGKLSFVEPAAGPWQELPQSFESFHRLVGHRRGGAH